MPSVFTPLLPSSAGLALGSPSLPWTIYSTNSNTILISGSAVNTIPWSVAPVLDASNSTALEMVLTGDVLTPTFISATASGFVQMVIFYIVQDAVGGHKWIWPPNFRGCQNIDNVGLSMTANQVMVQMVYWSGARAVATAASPMILFP